MSINVDSTPCSKLTTLLLLLLTGTTLLINIAYADKKPYTFGVFPYIPPQKVEQIWSPLVLHISRKIDVPLQLRTRSSYNTFKNEIENEYFDIAFMQPFVYANIGARHGYIPLARFVSLQDKNHKGILRAVFVALNENKNIKISDLKNKIIAAPPSTAAVTILGKEYLLKHGLKSGRDYQLSTQSNHHACLRQLIINNPIVCITARPPYIRYNDDINDRLSIIAVSEGIPSSVIAVHKRVIKKDKQKIKKVLNNLTDYKETRTFLKRGRFIDFMKTIDSDYDVVREMSKKTNNQ